MIDTFKIWFATIIIISNEKKEKCKEFGVCIGQRDAITEINWISIKKLKLTWMHK